MEKMTEEFKGNFLVKKSEIVSLKLESMATPGSKGQEGKVRNIESSDLVLESVSA